MAAKFRYSLLPAAVISCWFLAGLAVLGQEKQEPEFKAPALKPTTAKLPAAFTKPAPEGIADLKEMQDHVAMLVEKVSPAVVSVRVGSSSGSGVIVSKDGYVLTAGHVSGAANRDVTIYFHNRKETVKGKTLGGNHGIDTGMIKITTAGDWPFAEMGDSSQLQKGNWCLVIAHHGGFKAGRTPPVRLGRVLNNDEKKATLTTDAVLVGGDSGGPLFDMHGRVVGINSRIGQSLTQNMHASVNPFRDDWVKLAKGEVFGGKLGGGGFGKGGGPLYLGLQTDPMANVPTVLSIVAGGPAAKAGVKVKDIIKKVDDTELTSRFMLNKLVNAKKAGDFVTLEIMRGEERLTLKLEVTKRPQ